jgi:crotonobetainyl-CoA:carnitine CoA-transferase CaiB-like acyl-CoA transferase
MADEGIKMTGTKILAGIKILTLAYYVPGPVAAARLGAMGAHVTRIEPSDGDPLKQLCSAWYDELSAGHEIVRLNLKSEEGKEKRELLLADADLFISSVRLLALSHLGLDRERLHDRYPRLCQIAITGHPSPDQDRTGHDLTYGAKCGLLSPPTMPRTLLADLIGAERTVISALSLLFARERGNGAGYEEIALADGIGSFAAPLRYGLTRSGGILGGGSPRYSLYETREGYIAVAALEDHFWSDLTAELGADSSDAGYDELRKIFSTRTAVEWEEWAASRDLPIAAVRTDVLG